MHTDNASRRQFLGSVAVLGTAALTAPLISQAVNTPVSSNPLMTNAANVPALTDPLVASPANAPATGYPVVHFEIGCKDLDTTTGFYTDIFGWAKSPIPGGALIETNSKEGIQGHFTSLGHEPHQYITFYIQVDDIPAILQKVEAAGGQKVIGPFPLPDKRQFAWFKDPGGNMVALITKTPG